MGVLGVAGASVWDVHVPLVEHPERAALPPMQRGQERYLDRVPVPVASAAITAHPTANALGVTARFIEVIDEFAAVTPGATTPPGFRIEAACDLSGTLRFDLVRDISRDRSGIPRPTNLLFSVDSANPYEVAPCAGLVANMTCNPGIVYDLFLNNPDANIGGHFSTLEEVLTELGRILGPGVDMSVELNNPFADFDTILEQVNRYEQILSRHRLVVKVPHTGPVNGTNVEQLLSGDKQLATRYDQGATADYLYGHHLALKLHEHGYRVNFTLMFEPHQTPLALQARPTFINAFVRHRRTDTRTIKGLLAAYHTSGDRAFLTQLRSYLHQQDFLAADEADHDLTDVLDLATTTLATRHADDTGADGLDTARANLRWLRTANLPDTRLIICSMDGPTWYPDIITMLTEPEFIDLHNRVVITTEPNYLARWSSTPQVVAYQRRFMNAANTANNS